MTWVAVAIGLVAVADKLGTLWINTRRENQKQELDTKRAVEAAEMKAKVEALGVALANANEKIGQSETDRAELREELRACEDKHAKATAMHEEAIARIAKLEAA